VPASVQDDWPEADDVRRLASAFDAQEIQLFYQIANLGRSELALAPDEYAGFTMTLLRMLAFRPSAEPAPVGGQSGGGQARAATRPAPAASAPARSAVSAAPAVAARPADEPAVAERPRPVAVAPVSVPAAAAPPASEPPAATAAPVRRTSPAMEALAAARAASARGGSRGASRPAPSVPAAVPAPAPSSPVATRAPQAAANPPAQPQARPEPVRTAPESRPAPEQEEAGGSPPWEASAGNDVPPWDDMPSDFPPVTAYDDYGFDSAPARSAPARAQRRPDESMERAERAERGAAPAPVEARQPSRPAISADNGQPPVFTGDWPTLAASLPLKGLAGQLAQQSELAQVVGNTFHLRVPVAAIGKNDDVAERLQQALTEHLGQPVRVLCEVGAVSDTAAAADAAARAERQRAAEASIEADPFVQGLLREFGGQIVPGSIQPRAA
jgi:DNA polymerase-3 subunit gamma/tau